MSKLNSFQKFVFIIIGLAVLGILVALITRPFRYSEHRYIYLIGVIITYLFWAISILWGFINAIFILQNDKLKLKIKILRSLFSLLPLLYIAIMMIIVTIYDPLENDIVLPSGEHISGEYRQNDSIN
ncbi:MAG: hypothetical protein EOO46_17800 [Flavobacterium sp.]|nr:MAG: hypothetical protein EOO46_17800 [Flavobacterium sp.]